jgi:hypothetical protein
MDGKLERDHRQRTQNERLHRRPSRPSEDLATYQGVSPARMCVFEEYSPPTTVTTPALTAA